MQEPVRLPKDAVAIIYVAPIARRVIGASGQPYQVRPHTILVDVKAEDALVWLAAKQAKKPTLHEMSALDGYLARLPSP